MKVHINQIPHEGKHFEGEESADFLGLKAQEFVEPAGPVSYSLDVGLSGGGLFATGMLAVDLDMKCVACLEAFEYPLQIDDFACQMELTGAELVDLTPMAREDILLALPAHPHCDWNGQKDCKGPPILQSDESETSSDAREVWGALDQLNLKKSN